MRELDENVTYYITLYQYECFDLPHFDLGAGVHVS
jgi:hypothetical protein